VRDIATSLEDLSFHHLSFASYALMFRWRHEQSLAMIASVLHEDTVLAIDRILGLRTGMAFSATWFSLQVSPPDM
jgi:hypothetical protein